MTYNGKHIGGKGDAAWLELIDKSFGMLHSSPTLPNLKMLYKSATDHFSEGFIWGNGWWIQNSYGFTLGAVPLLDPFWSHILQNSYDAFWTRIGNGKRVGADDGSTDDLVYALCAPDGALGDCVLDKGIVYRQGDGNFMAYDWFYEATAAGVNMQADMLLFDRRPEMLEKYVPLLWRSLNHIESTRAENGLFLVGPAANLLAPSYGGSFNEETGEIGKGYLTGVAVTYAAALKKFIEILKMTGDTEGQTECQNRLDRTLAALPLLLTEEGYFVKSMDPDGTKHGVYGADKHGYLEAVCNVDAIAGNIVDDKTAESIYAKIASVEGIRPAGTICNNYPHLDDTYENYVQRNYGPNVCGCGSGNWVDGGCWATVEGRAILAYQKLGKYDDTFRAADWYMKWAEEYRQDAPLSQWGWNTNNPWSAENDDHTVCNRPAAVMIDNFAPVTCLLRGLFGYTADARGLWITPQIPDCITEYIQHEPVWFGGCAVWIAYKNGSEAPIVTLDGQEVGTVQPDGSIFLPAGLFERDEELCLKIDASGGGRELRSQQNVCPFPGNTDGLPEDLAEIYADVLEQLKKEQNPLRASMLLEIALSAEAAAERRSLPFDRHELRPMTDEKRDVIVSAYDNTVRELYKGLKYRE